ncbi:unnamed protein product, partial [Ectocarpus sp. 13 AM-2016]
WVRWDIRGYSPSELEHRLLSPHFAGVCACPSTWPNPEITASKNELSIPLGVFSRLLVHDLVATIVCSVHPRRSSFCRTFVEGSTSQVVRRSLPTRPGSNVGVI